MSKFLKFQPTLDLEETMQLLKHMTSEEVDAGLIQSMTSNGYFHPILGRRHICVGFDDRAIDMLLAGTSVKPTAVSIIGVAASQSSVFSEDPGEIKFSSCVDASDNAIHFALPATRDAERPDLIRSYTLAELASLDPDDQGNQSFMTAEVIRVGEAANDFKFPEKADLPTPVLTLNSFADLTVVTEIKGLPYVHSMGMIDFDPRTSVTQQVERQPPSKNLVLAALLEIVTTSDPRRWNQDGLANEIQDRFQGIRGLSKKTATNQFSEAKKALTVARHGMR